MAPWNEYNKGKKKKETIKDFNQFDHVKNGQLYLTTDNGERKATGSYYTPDYIVNYIVENTVGPIVEARWKDALINNSSLIEAALSVKVLDQPGVYVLVGPTRKMMRQQKGILRG